MKLLILNEEIFIYLIKMIYMSICTYFTSLKISNIKIKLNFSKVTIYFLFLILISLFLEMISNITRFDINSIIYIIFIDTMFLYLTTDCNIGYSVLLNTISLTVNQIIFLIATMISFIPHLILSINIEIINFIVIIFVHLILLIYCLRLKRIKNGISFLIKNKYDEYFNLVILNISLIVLFFIVFTSNYQEKVTWKFGIGSIIFSVMMISTIQKSLQLYYKQKMLVKDLEETKAELEEKNIRIKELENEIIKSGKKSHSISHRQDILEHKLEELNMKSEISEMDIKSRIEKVGKDIRKEPVIVLAKTGIAEIDDVLDYMKSECVKKKIDFQLQLSGNIYKMINNYVGKDELEILLADHIKNAIIAIEYSNNINKSILVRLGRLDGTYGLYVYDSGIEFEKETLLKLGKKPATTHKDSGGTGMGFMNTFDTLRKHNASFIIEEYGKPVTDNCTKVLKFKFDGKKEFKICTYRKEEIEKQDKEKTLVVEKLIF